MTAEPSVLPQTRAQIEAWLKQVQQEDFATGGRKVFDRLAQAVGIIQAQLEQQVSCCTPAPATEEPTLVITGTPLQGFFFYGPFDSATLADAWARIAHCDQDYWIGRLSPPQPGP